MIQIDLVCGHSNSHVGCRICNYNQALEDAAKKLERDGWQGLAKGIRVLKKGD